MKYYVKGYLANGGEDAMNTLKCQKPWTQIQILTWIMWDTIWTLVKNGAPESVPCCEEGSV